MRNPNFSRPAIIERFGLAAAAVMLSAAVVPVAVGLESHTTTPNEHAVMPEPVQLPQPGEAPL